MNRAPFTIAVLLGIAGLIPFLAGLAVIVTDPTRAPVATTVMIDYGACILAFLGAVHWGFALEPGGIVPEARLNNQRLLFGVLPALVGWLALLVLSLAQAPRLAIAILIAGFFATIVAETVGRGRDIVPGNYLALRWAISIVVLAVLIVALFIEAVGMRQG